MVQPLLSYHFYPLGDIAITVDFGNCINEEINRVVLSLFHQLKQHPLPGTIEAVPAYSSLTVYFDPIAVKKLSGKIAAYEWVKQQLQQRLNANTTGTHNKTDKIVRIPVCYESEFAPDISSLAAAKNILPRDVTALHTAKTYRVYMLGFLPGFAYMGKVDDKIAIPRKKEPVNVPAGSVGIAGSQTGIYPLHSPGGWHIIGRTPLKLFDTEKEEPALLRPGDQVQFYSISKKEYEEIQNTNFTK